MFDSNLIWVFVKKLLNNNNILLLIVLSFYGKIYFKIFKFNINIKVINILKYCIHVINTNTYFFIMHL